MYEVPYYYYSKVSRSSVNMSANVLTVFIKMILILYPFAKSIDSNQLVFKNEN